MVGDTISVLGDTISVLGDTLFDVHELEVEVGLPPSLGLGFAPCLVRG